MGEEEGRDGERTREYRGWGRRGKGRKKGK